MRITLFSTKKYDREFFERENRGRFEFVFVEAKLSATTASLATGSRAVCVFVSDTLDASVLEQLSGAGVQLVALRCAGFNNVDLVAAKRLGIRVVRVPAYSPHAVAEHTLALVLSLNRKIHRAYQRVREGNFALDGLLGFDLHGKTVGIVGTGKIGCLVAGLFSAFGCRVLAYDPAPDPELTSAGVQYVALEQLCRESDIVSLHCPLTAQTKHLLSAGQLKAMKRGVMIVNTGRGALVDTKALIAALKTGQVGSLALDVYEEEAEIFFEDLSERIIQDDVFMRLLTFPNVLITGHQAFFTVEALTAIAQTTLDSCEHWQRGSLAESVVVA